MRAGTETVVFSSLSAEPRGIPGTQQTSRVFLNDTSTKENVEEPLPSSHAPPGFPGRLRTLWHARRHTWHKNVVCLPRTGSASRGGKLSYVFDDSGLED